MSGIKQWGSVKPAAILRARERAAQAEWARGKEARAKHIHALTTRARERDEDYREMVRKQEAASMKQSLDFQMQWARIWRGPKP